MPEKVEAFPRPGFVPSAWWDWTPVFSVRGGYAFLCVLFADRAQTDSSHWS